LEFLNTEYEKFQINFNQIKEEKDKLINEMNRTIISESINNEIPELEIIRKENEKLHQTINELNEKLDKKNSNSDENIPVNFILFFYYY
jgi:hypothetical protein